LFLVKFLIIHNYNRMDGYLIATIVLSCILSGIIIVGVLTKFGYLQNASNSLSEYSGVSTFGIMMMNMVPVAVFFTSFVIDFINQEVRTSLPAMVSFGISLLLRIAFGVSGLPLTPQPDTSGNIVWCTFPGFEFFENPWVPSTLFITAFMSIYYLLWNLNSIPVIALAIVSMTSAIAAYAMGKCAYSYYPFLGRSWLTPLIALGLGALLGSITYATMKNGIADDARWTPFPDRAKKDAKAATDKPGPKPVTGDKPGGNPNCVNSGTCPQLGQEIVLEIDSAQQNGKTVNLAK